MIKPTTIALHLLMLSIFSGAFVLSDTASFLNGPVLFSMAAFAVLAASGSIRVHKTLGFAILFLFLHSVITQMFGFGNIQGALKVLVTFSTMTLAFYSAIRFEGVDRTIQTYLKYVTVIAVIGLAQAVAFKAGYKIGYDFSSYLPNWRSAPGGPLGLRISSILFEPSQVAFTCGLAISLSVFRVLGQRNNPVSLARSILILLFALASGSTVTYFLALLTFAIASLKKAVSVLIAIVVLGIGAAQVNEERFDDVFVRVQGMYELYVLQETGMNANASTFSLFAHTQVATLNFRETMGFGSGIGSHGQRYQAFENKVYGTHEVFQVGTAGNLFNRALSELGIFGIALLCYFLIKAVPLFLPGKSDVLATSIFLAFFAFLARNGTYSYYGFAMLVSLLILYVPQKKEVRRKLVGTFSRDLQSKPK